MKEFDNGITSETVDRELYYARLTTNMLYEANAVKAPFIINKRKAIDCLMDFAWRLKLQNVIRFFRLEKFAKKMLKGLIE